MSWLPSGIAKTVSGATNVVKSVTTVASKPITTTATKVSTVVSSPITGLKAALPSPSLATATLIASPSKSATAVIGGVQQYTGKAISGGSLVGTVSGVLSQAKDTALKTGVLPTAVKGLNPVSVGKTIKEVAISGTPQGVKEIITSSGKIGETISRIKMPQVDPADIATHATDAGRDAAAAVLAVSAHYGKTAAQVVDNGAGLAAAVVRDAKGVALGTVGDAVSAVMEAAGLPDKEERESMKIWFIVGGVIAAIIAIYLMFFRKKR